jgi:hypothetical protein
MKHNEMSLGSFLETGKLGEVGLGSGLNDVLALLGDPDDQSKKSNPLVLRYGLFGFSFVRRPGEKWLFLSEISFVLSETTDESAIVTKCDQIERVQAELLEHVTLALFDRFVSSLDLSVSRELVGHNVVLVFPSGIRVTFSHAQLARLDLAWKEVVTRPAVHPGGDEPSTRQIIEMLREAEQLTQRDHARAALITSWAGLEAALRRKAIMAGFNISHIKSPVLLARQLNSTNNITDKQLAVIDRTWPLRTKLVHGFVSSDVSPSLIREANQVARELVNDMDDDNH